jgi:electron transport complex protein RnfB
MLAGEDPMSEQVYRDLAKTLDTIPPGFPLTESGVGLELLAHLFSPDEAALAAAMSASFMSPEAIAKAAGTDPGEAPATLTAMEAKGLVRVKDRDGAQVYSLPPNLPLYVPGVRLGRDDVEIRRLRYRYRSETRGVGARYGPAMVRVIPVQETVAADLWIHPLEQAVTMVHEAKSWGVATCPCHIDAATVDTVDCDHPWDVCLHLSYEAGVFEEDGYNRPISKDEALAILRVSEDAGLVHCTYNWDNPGRIITVCNCCPKVCPCLRAVIEMEIPGAVARSSFIAEVDASVCVGCGDCADRCLFGALSMGEDTPLIALERCMGCGLCAKACTTGALKLVPRPEGENPPRPADQQDLITTYAAGRGMRLPEW